MYDQREVILIPFPYSDLTGSKQRPALVISNKSVNSTQDRVCCLITSKKPSNGVQIAQNAITDGSLPFQSWVKPHRLFTIDTRIVKKRLCTVSPKLHNRVIAELSKLIE